jgi:8-oxo-dGTP diphosphatase
MIDYACYLIANVEAIVVREDGRYLMVVRSAEEEVAPGALALPGGKVEVAEPLDDALEETARREVREEAGVEVEDIQYLRSYLFYTEQREPVLDVIVLCRYRSGEARPGDPREVAGVGWMPAEEILGRPETPPWLRRNIELAERRRSTMTGGQGDGEARTR